MPHPVILRNHVLVMEFVGLNGWPAPLLKDVKLNESKARELYMECVRILRDIYQKAYLVHADLSEFNMLFSDEGQLRIIDVSQAVEHDHPHALNFLRKDCTNITEFFQKFGVQPMTVQALFNFVTDKSITEDNIDEYLTKAQEIAITTVDSNEEKVKAEVFKQSYIPRVLDEVRDFEGDLRKVKNSCNGTDEVLYREVIGLSKDMKGASTVPVLLENMEDDANRSDDEVAMETDGTDNDSEDQRTENENSSNLHNSSHKTLSKEENKERKRLFKSAKKENRTNKTPKHVKKARDKRYKKK